MSCSIKVNNEHKIVYYQHNGAIGINNICDAWKRVLSTLKQYGMGYNLLIDFREAYFVFKPYEIDDIVTFFYSTIDILHGKRIAGIAQESHETAILKLINTLNSEELDYQIRVFKTTEKAFDFLYLK